MAAPLTYEQAALELQGDHNRGGDEDSEEDNEDSCATVETMASLKVQVRRPRFPPLHLWPEQESGQMPKPLGYPWVLPQGTGGV